MDKAIHPYDKEGMRLAMLKHEETFKQQVNELHRLYRIQKMLMDGAQQTQKHQRFLIPGTINNNTNTNNNKSSTSTFQINGHHHLYRQKQPQINGDNQLSKHNIMMMGSNGPPQLRIAESNAGNNATLSENEIELSLSLGPITHIPRRRKMDISKSGHQTTLSSSSTGSSQTKRIRSPNNKKNCGSGSTRGGGDIDNNAYHHQFTWDNNNKGNNSFSQGSERNKPGFSNGQQTGNNPSWTLHALSLKLS